MTDDFVVYLTQPERAKNILQNEVASDFVFILKMREIHGTSDVIGLIRTHMCMRAFFKFVVDKFNQHTQGNDWQQLPSFRKSLSLVAGFCEAWVQETGNEVDNPYGQPAS